MTGAVAPSSGVVAARVGKEFGGGARPVLRDVDLWVPPGGCTAVLGPSGAGKTVLLRCLAGLERPTRGAVRIGGVDLAGLDELERTEFRRERIGVIHPVGNLLPELTVQDNVLLPFDLAGRRPDPEMLAQALDRLAIRDLLDRRPQRLSRADQLRVALARALVQQPDVLLVDEPVGRLDALTARNLLRLLSRCGRGFDLGVVLFSAHPVAAVYADRIIALRDGRVEQDRQPAAGRTPAGARESLERIA